MTSPTTTLRTAATRLRELAKAATSGPWVTYTDPNDAVFDQYGIGVQSSASHDVVAYSGQIYSRDADYIAALHPDVALRLADWLESMATMIDEAGDGPLAIVVAGLAEPALALAHTFLGEVAE